LIDDCFSARRKKKKNEIKNSEGEISGQPMKFYMTLATMSNINNFELYFQSVITHTQDKTIAKL
jgi:hypothetical protein